MNKTLLMLSCAAGAFVLMTGGAYAATATDTTTAASTGAATSSDTSGGQVLDVVVTAEKREVSVQQTPVAVSAFVAKQRDLEGISTIQDMTNFTPGLTYSSQLDRAAMRGLARLSNALSANSSVAVYIDDLYSTSTFQVGLDDMFIDRVEIERGPQGTLYGRNAIGGLINSVSKRPTEDFSGEMRVEYGNFDHSNVEATVSGPLAKGLTARISGFYTNQNQGYLTNVAPGQPSEGGVVHDWYLQGQLEWKPTDQDDLWLALTSQGFNGDRGGPGGLLGIPLTGPYDTGLASAQNSNLTYNPNFGYNPTQPAILPLGGTTTGPVAGSVVGIPPGFANNPALTNIRDFAHAIPTSINLNDTYSINLHWTHKFDGFQVKYVGGYNQYNYLLDTNWYATSNSSVTQYQLPLNPAGPCANIPGCTNLSVAPSENFRYPEHNKWTSHEVTFSSTDSSPLQWIAGAYYYDQNYEDPTQIQMLGQSQYANPVTFNGTPASVGALLTGTATAAAPNPSQAFYTARYKLETTSEAVYGQPDYKITDTLKLTGGLRYTYDKKTGVEDYRLVAFSDALAAYGYSAANYGSMLKAIDFTFAALAPTGVLSTAYKGVSCLPTVQTSGTYAGAYQRCLDGNSSAVTGTAGIEWTPTSDMLGYLRYNRGYKAFGFNAGTITPNPEAAPELVDDIEIGFKQSIGRVFEYNVDAFYYNYMDDQVPIGVNTGATVVTEFINIPKAVSDGIELQAVWSPVDHLSLNFTYSYDHTEITSGCSLVANVPTGTCIVDANDPTAHAAGAKPVGTSGQQSVAGSELPESPANKVSLNATYTWVFGPGDFSLSGTYIWKDKSYGTIWQRSYNEAPSWDQVDLRAVWAGSDHHYEIVGFVKNLFNTNGYDAADVGTFTSIGTQLTAYDLTPPRTYGVEIHYKW